MVAVLCALGAALLYALASVLQQRSAARLPEEHSLRIGLLTRLVRSRVWLAGVAADLAGFGLQFAAIASGTIVIVQPLLVAGLLFALPIGARLDHDRLRRADWVGATAVCAGLAVFLVVANPAPGRSTVQPGVWPPLLAAGLGLGVVLAALGARSRGRSKAVYLSASAGIIYGVAAGLTKTTGSQLGTSIVGAFTHWELYALVAVGVGGMVVAQSAFQAGSLDVSLPTMTAIDPVVSICIGALAFGEVIAGDPVSVVVEVVSLVVMVAGIYALARSPAVRRTREAPVPAA